MGRRRTSNRHLPARMQLKHGAYYHVAAGVWRRLAPASDYGAALRAYAEIEGSRATQARTVAAAVAEYLRACAERVGAGELSGKTLTGYTASSVPLIAVLGSVGLEDLTDAEVRRYRNERATAAGKPAPIAANREIALLSAAYGHAAERGWIAASINPCRGLKRNRERPRRRYLADAEIAAVQAKATPMLAAAIRLALATGMRQGDLLRLRLDSATDDGVRVVAGKTGKALTVEWSPELRAAWAAAVALRRRACSPWLFDGRRRNGKPLTPSGLQTEWDRACDAAGLKDAQWRDLRRKVGSDTTESHAVELLDHSTSAVTRKHYRAKPKRVPAAR